jgi:hypothetical protein
LNNRILRKNWPVQGALVYKAAQMLE